MPIAITRVTVGAAAGLLVEPASLALIGYTTKRPTAVIIRNAAAASIYLGPDSSVTTANGYEVPTLASISLDLNGDDSIWAIAAGAGNVVHVMSQT